MKRKLIILLTIMSILVVSSLPLMLVMAAPTTISTTVTAYPLSTHKADGKTFWCNGRHWVFWWDGNDIVYSTSSDNGATWSVHTDVKNANWSALEFDVWCDSSDNTLQYACADYDFASSALYYRKGSCNADGSITWAAIEQTAVAGVAGHTYPGISITTLSTGEPVIAYLDYTGALQHQGVPYITLSSTTNGVWTTAAGYPYQFDAATYWSTALSSFSTGTYGALAMKSNGTLEFKYNDVGGAGWGGLENIASCSTDFSRAFDVTVQSDDGVHVIYNELVSKHHVHAYRNYNTAVWDSAHISTLKLYKNQISALSDNNLIVTIMDSTLTASYYREYVSSTATWDADWHMLYDSASTTSESQIATPYNNYGSKWWTVFWEEAVGNDPLVYEDIDAPTCTTLTVDEGITDTTFHGTCNTTTGTEGAYVRFNYGTTSAYGSNTAWQYLASANTFDAYQGGLSEATLYHWRAEVSSSFGWDYGADKTFTTNAYIDAPTNLIAVPLSSSEVSLSWEAGTDADSSVLRYDTAGYPAYGAGTLLYSGTAESFFMDNATGGTTYYFSAWSLVGGTSHSTADNCMATTPAGYLPSGFTDTSDTGPSSTVLDSSPAAGLISWISTYGQLPKASVGLLGFFSIFMFVLVAVAITSRSVAATIVFAGVGLAMGRPLGVISLLCLALAMMVGVALGHLRGGQPSG